MTTRPKRRTGENILNSFPQRLQQEGVDPRVPGLSDFKLDCRFK